VVSRGGSYFFRSTAMSCFLLKYCAQPIIYNIIRYLLISNNRYLPIIDLMIIKKDIFLSTWPLRRSIIILHEISTLLALMLVIIIAFCVYYFGLSASYTLLNLECNYPSHIFVVHSVSERIGFKVISTI